MKNLFIIGVPRSGKSTLSKMIKKEYPIYNQLSFEAIRNGFIETQPELDMGNRNSDARKMLLPKHIVTVAHWNQELLSCPSLVEGDFCSIEKLNELVSEDDMIICLGFGCRTMDEIVDGIMKNHMDDDYTKEWSSEEIKKHFYDSALKDQLNYDYCMSHNIPYYDTYENREEVFLQILQSIKALS